MDAAGIYRGGQEPVVIGTATTVISAAKRINVTINGTDVKVRASRDLTVAVGDVVLMVRAPNVGLVVISRLYAAAPDSSDDGQSQPPAPQPTTIHGQTVITPVETRSYQGSKWRTDNDDVYQGEYGGWGNHTGCAFYGNKPRSLKGATVTSAWIRAKRVSGGDYAAKATTLRRITNKTRPAGAPTLVGGSDNGPHLKVGGSSTHIVIPTLWAQNLVDGSSGGLAIFDSGGSPYVRLAGRSDWSQSWALTVNWSRTT